MNSARTHTDTQRQTRLNDTDTHTHLCIKDRGGMGGKKREGKSKLFYFFSGFWKQVLTMQPCYTGTQKVDPGWLKTHARSLD